MRHQRKSKDSSPTPSQDIKRLMKTERLSLAQDPKWTERGVFCLFRFAYPLKRKKELLRRYWLTCHVVWNRFGLAL